MTDITVACISDTHTMHTSIPGGIPPCDLLIHAGDMTSVGGYDKLIKFNDWGGSLSLPSERKICIAGNHDKTLENDVETARALLPNWTYLQDETHEVLGLKIWGTPWSAEFYPETWGFQLRRGEVAKACWEMIPDDTDIVVVHGPPHGFGDLVDRGEHVGSKELTKRLMQVKPILTVCGHIHSAYGVYAAPWGTVVNACIMTEGYKPKRKAIAVKL